MGKHSQFCLFIFSIIYFSSKSIFCQVYINEIMVNPSGSNDGSNMPNTSEWIEFYNSSASAVNISCWVFTDGDFSVTFPSGTTIPAGGYYTVASASGSGLTPNLDWATCGCTTNNPGNNESLTTNQIGIFTNGSEQVLLYDNTGVIQDAIIWGGGQLANLTLTINATASCTSKTLAMTTSTVGYENIGTQSDGIAKERSVDGGSTWQNAGSGSFGGTNAIILPIELISFDAEIENNGVILKWQTATEINNDFFTVEKSENAIDFETITTIEGAGNSNVNNFYSYVDSNPFPGINYYRLKQTDYDGKYSYSEITSIENTKSLLVSAYPNPCDNGIFKIIVGNYYNYSINIFDNLGNIIKTEENSSSETTINLSNYPKGIYLILLKTKNETFTQKIIYN